MPFARPSTDPSAPPALQAEIAPLLDEINRIASAHSGDPQALLVLLRHLEQLHRTIQDGPFRSSLPSERSTLFRLLQDMELSGGWPYIPRLQLRTFLDLLQKEGCDSSPEDSAPEQAQAA
jgi:hypothetical protein